MQGATAGELGAPRRAHLQARQWGLQFPAGVVAHGRSGAQPNTGCDHDLAFDDGPYADTLRADRHQQRHQIVGQRRAIAFPRGWQVTPCGDDGAVHDAQRVRVEAIVEYRRRGDSAAA